MKLSEIVDYLNLLDSLQVDHECTASTKNLAAILHVVNHHNTQLNAYGSDLARIFAELSLSISKFGNVVNQLKENLQQQLRAQEPEYLRESLRLFEHEMPFESTDYVLNRRLSIMPDDNIELRSRLKNITDWRLPGMIIRPGLDTFIEDLVPMDPLYVVDTHQDLINPAVRKFTPDYQRRLREYVINDRQPEPIMSQLPNDQFGLIFAYNYFNYKPIEIVRRYLTELHIKLRPGGSLIMTYNNCDQSHGVGLAERCWMLYTPKRLILEHAANIGLEYVMDRDCAGDVSWIEFKRFGDIDSTRGGQTLAKIIAIPQ